MNSLQLHALFFCVPCGLSSATVNNMTAMTSYEIDFFVAFTHYCKNYLEHVDFNRWDNIERHYLISVCFVVNELNSFSTFVLNYQMMF